MDFRKAGQAVIALCLWTIASQAQNGRLLVSCPRESDLSGPIRFLSSDWMEGRAAGSVKSFYAAGFIAFRMESAGLEPCGDPVFQNTAGEAGTSRSWFQDFRVIRFKAGQASLDFIEDQEGSRILFYEFTGIDTARLSPAQKRLFRVLHNPGIIHRFAASGKVRSTTFAVANVLGLLRGKDTTRCLIVGAHYDHLGKWGGETYNGADDNASGVSGMLSLANCRAASQETPPCNIIFAAWTAEEEGEIGSHYFVRYTGADAGKVLAYINMDMISRSDPADTSHRQLSIGTRTLDESLRLLATEANSALPEPFELDLWDVTGHFGSDYAYFAVAGIPVMTFFSGFHDDYHTPGDDFGKVDLYKMNTILGLVNSCMEQILEQEAKQ
jgi:hypothetical protein